MFPTLDECTPRLLTLLAQIMSDQDAVVVLTERVAHPVVVAMDGRTLTLNPRLAGLFDLCLAARLLRWRAEARTLRDDQSHTESARQRARRDDHLPKKLSNSWVRQALKTLRDDFPRIERLPAYFDKRNSTTWPRVVWRRVEFNPMENGALPVHSKNLVFNALSTLEVTGSDDYGWLLDAIASGRFPMQQFPELRELPVVVVPLRITANRRPGPQYERYQRELARHRDSVKALTECYIRKAEAENPLPFIGQHRVTGANLDSNRLVEAVVARHTGILPKLFKDRQKSYQPIFDERQHHVVLALDVNGLAPGPIGDPGFSQRALAVFVETYGNLGVDFSVLGCADRVVELPDGRKVYLHAPVLLKDVTDPLDGAFHNRLAHLIEAPPQLPGEPACFHPLLMREVRQQFAKADASQHHYRTILLAAPRGMPDWPEFLSEQFLSRAANALDDQITAIERDYDGILDALGGFVPRGMIQQARRGGYVAQMF